MNTSTMLALIAVGLVACGASGEADETGTTEEAALSRLPSYNKYPSDRQSYQLELGAMAPGPAGQAAFEYANQVIRDPANKDDGKPKHAFNSYGLQSFKTTAAGFTFIFKDRQASRTIPGKTTNQYPHRCLKIKVEVGLSPTDAFPKVTRVKALPDATEGTLCMDNGEI